MCTEAEPRLRVASELLVSSDKPRLGSAPALPRLGGVGVAEQQAGSRSERILEPRPSIAAGEVQERAPHPVGVQLSEALRLRRGDPATSRAGVEDDPKPMQAGAGEVLGDRLVLVLAGIDHHAIPVGAR